MKIFLCGDTGRLNRGCEAIVRSTVELLGNKEIYLATFTPERNMPMTKEIGISMIPYNSYPSIIHRFAYVGIRKIFKKSLAGLNIIQKPLFKKMAKQDICLNIGGDTYCYQRPAISLALNNFTHKNKIKSILWCCSIEKNKIKGEIVRDLKKYKFIFAREQITVNNLIESGISPEKVVKVCDPAFFLKTKEVELPEGFKEGKTIGINLSDCVCYGTYTKSYDNVKYLINWILNNTDMSICLIPHVYDIEDEKHHDLPILKRLHKEINDTRVAIVDKEYDCEQLKYIISKCRYFVGARTHSTIAAYSTKIPTLVIGYSVKAKGIATDLFGQYQDYVLPFDGMKNDDELLIAFKKLMQNEEWIKKRYDEFLPQYRNQLLEAVDKYIFSDNVAKKDYICDLEQCSGCSACANVCPVQAISMAENAQGFLYPNINTEKCIDCYKCRKTCPVLNKFLDDGKEPLAFAVKNNDDAVRRMSSSGGVFNSLAQKVIDKGGQVFTPAFDKNFNLNHIMVDNKENVQKLLGSKYVQSQIGDCYKQVLKALEQGNQVLFSGTPCQVGGLKAFLKKDYDNLITQDIICHGVPSLDSFKKYLEYRKRKAHADSVANIVFREKQGDGSTCLKIEFSNGQVYKGDYTKDKFIKSFLSNLNIRTACLDCSFKQKHRTSDITLGDFWGAETYAPQMDDGKGVSLVMLHTEKAIEFISDIKNELQMQQVVFNDAIKYNPSFLYSTKENPFRNEFFKKVTVKNVGKLVDKYAGTSFLAKLRRRIKKFFS